MNAPSSPRLIYIAAADEDAELWYRFHRELEAQAGSDFNIWSSRESLPLRSDWDTEIQEAQKRAAGAILVLSSHSLNSPVVREDVKHLQQLRVPLFSLVVEECDWRKFPGVANSMIFDETRPLNSYPAETQHQKIREFVRVVLAKLRDEKMPHPQQTQPPRRDHKSEEREGARISDEATSEPQEERDDALLREWGVELTSRNMVAEILQSQEGSLLPDQKAEVAEALASDQRQIRNRFRTEADLPEEARRMIAQLSAAEASFRQEALEELPGDSTTSTQEPTEAAQQKDPAANSIDAPPLTIDQFSAGSRRILGWANAFRKMLKQRHVHTEHLIAALHQSNDPLVLEAFKKARIDLPELLSILHQSEFKIPITLENIRIESGEAAALPVLSGGAKAGLGFGLVLARSEKTHAVLPRHLLFGVLSVDAPAADTLRKRGLRRELPQPEIAPTPSPAPLHVSRRSFALFQSDVPPPEVAGKETAVPDALKLGDYARHLAEMMGARETPLPLSLGLFGDWGTGKTHFMRLLREKMRAQANRAGSPWCQRVVTVPFNAWHYLDANLWASLVTEIFEKLFKSIDRDEKTPKEKKDELLRKLESEKGAAAKAKDEVRRAKVTERLARWKLWKAQKVRDKKRLTLAGKLDEAGALIEIVKETPEGKELMRSWGELCQRLGWGELETSATGLRAQIAQTRSLGVRAQVLWETAFSPERRARTVIVLVAALVVVPFLGSAVGHVLGSWHEGMEKVGRITGAVSGWLTTVGACLAFWAQRAQKYLGNAEQLDRRLSAAIKKRAETPEIVGMRDALKAAEVVTNAAEKGLVDAQARVRALEDELREQEPERRLLKFIGDRAKADDYRKHLGLVSLVRRDFETLSNLFAEIHTEGRMEPKVEGTLEAAVDRIILYVDDLDRCPAKRVVEVLEAVHLLLAFPLFVVVVAVDPRWLQRSLRQHYPELLDEKSGRHRRATTAIAGERSATPLDYLEKIFHVPFHLPRMEDTGYRELVVELTKFTEEDKGAGSAAVAEIGAEPPPRQSTTSAAADSKPTNGRATAEPKEFVEKKTGNVADSLTPSADPPPQSVRLSSKEIEALQQYASFIRTPRAVKRLLNTYRLVRAGLDELPADKLPPGADMAERCRPAMLLLAVAAGFPALARDLFTALQKDDGWRTTPPPELQAVPEFAELHNAIRTGTNLPLGLVTPVDWRWWIDRVGRFSF
ncbi:MAG TPA: P-loop NTPase fold protein [Chthoniobacterales bacterium]|nr:P-loop NTPase fold protein [Chthoniobacterales bacterium]